MNIGVRPRFIRRSDFFYAWLAATLLSGIPSTLYAVATGRDAMEATRAAAAMFPLSGNVVIDAALVHTAVSLFWAALLGILDLRVIAPRFFPEVAALELWPQMADHLMWGACFGLVLQIRRRRGIGV
jgi:hypothetical protein